MTTEIYNKRLVSYAKEKLSVKFDLTEINKLFSGQHQEFNLLNFFLLCKCIESSEEFNFQILIPDKYYKEELLSALLLSLSIIKYRQNNNSSSTRGVGNTPTKGDIYYIGNRICQIQKKDGEKCTLSLINQSKIERENQVEIPKFQNELKTICKLRKNFPYNRNTPKHLQEYINFYKKYIDNYSFLSIFHRRSIIICNSQILSQNQKLFLPFIYQGKKADSIPVMPLIQVFNKYDEARSFLKKNIDIDEVIVVGYKKYQNLFGQILNDRNSGLFNKLILIGSKKVNDNSFKFWQWTQKEINSLSGSDETNGRINRKLVSDKRLSDFKKQLSTFKISLSSLGVNEDDLEAINHYFITFFSQQLDDNNLEQTASYIQSLFKEENDFDEAISLLSIEQQEQYKGQYLSIINDFLIGFKNEKITILKQLRFDKKHYIISPRDRQLEALKQHIKSGNNKKSEVITNKKIERMIKNDEVENPDKTVFVVPHVRFHYDRPLWYYHLYNKALAYGDVQFVCYEGIDEKRLDLFENLYTKREQYRITHADRCWFVNVPYEVEKSLAEDETELIENLDVVNASEDLDTSSLKKVKQYFKTQFKVLEELKPPKAESKSKSSSPLERKSKTYYWVIFKSTDNKKIGEYELVPKKVTGKYEFTEGHNLKVSDKIIADWKLILKDVLPMLKGLKGFRKEIKEIEQAGLIWQQWLSGLYRYYQNKESSDDKALSLLHQRLDLSVSKPTLKRWLNTKDKLLFPRANQDLENIFILREKLSPDKESIRAQKDRLTRGSVSLLYKIKNELDEYSCTSEKGEIISKIKNTDLDKLIKTRQIKQIQKIEEL